MDERCRGAGCCAWLRASNEKHDNTKRLDNDGLDNDGLDNGRKTGSPDAQDVRGRDG